MSLSPRSLEPVIEAHASQFAVAMQKALSRARTEADIRSAADRQLATVERAAGIALNSHHEFTVASGRIDSLYDRVIVEYKNPKSTSDRIGETLSDHGTKKAVDQIKSRFDDIEKELGHPITSLFGVGIDGRRFVFVRYRLGRWIEESPVPITAHTSATFLWALFNLNVAGKAYHADNLAADFGSESDVAGHLVRAFYAAITKSGDPKCQTFYGEWKSLFSLVCGYDVLTSHEKIRRLADAYGVASQGEVDPPALLFAAHTYFAVFMKILASEIVSFFHKHPSPVQRLLRAPHSERLRIEAERLEAGGIFKQIGIQNFLEGDLFCWYLSAWDSDIDSGLRKVASRLDSYNLGSLSESPSHNHDLLKALYLQIIPREVRHDLGEYYTPDWLAELTMNRAGFEGDPQHRVLDPACGSGTFLVIAISRLKRYYEFNRERISLSEREFLKTVLANVVGFDINPLAVLASRTNYLIAIRELLIHADEIELPVYLSDSVATPVEYGDLFSGTAAIAHIPCAATQPPFLNVPREVGANADTVARYAAAIEHCLKIQASPSEFVQECRNNAIIVEKDELHEVLFKELGPVLI
jgi:SAM-dependent methyltransferase